MSEERRASMAAYGAELISVPAGKMELARDMAAQMAARGEGVVLDQFGNLDNPLAHYRTTGAGAAALGAVVGGCAGASCAGAGGGCATRQHAVARLESAARQPDYGLDVREADVHGDHAEAWVGRGCNRSGGTGCDDTGGQLHGCLTG